MPASRSAGSRLMRQNTVSGEKKPAPGSTSLPRSSKYCLNLSLSPGWGEGLMGTTPTVIPVLVQRMFVAADRVIALGIYCRYCILQRRILTKLVFGGHDARQTEGTPDPASQWLAALR